ncbi:MAG: DUF1330 domain-containing protein [Bdellovibrionota bacterium]
MKAYAMAFLYDVVLGDEILAYIKGIDDTIIPFGGKFIIHGDTPSVKEGSWDKDIIVIEFPSMKMAEDWYHSPDYEKIKDFRTRNSKGTLLIVDGVGETHKAIDILSRF